MAADSAPIELHARHPAAPTLGWRGSAGPAVVFTDLELPGMLATAPRAASDHAPAADSPPRLRYGRGWIDAAEREFELREHAMHTELACVAGCVAWTNDGRRVWLPQPPAHPRAQVELALGVGLVGALSARGVFCLHASAVRWRDGLLAAVAASGGGKSTFARAAHGSARARRAADDILPVDDSALAWPAFPQLKLDPGDWWPSAAGALPLRALVVLERGADAACVRLDPPALMRALLAHTAGARAFTTPVQAAHLAWCAALAGRCTAFALRVAVREAAPESAALEALDALERAA